MAQQIDDPVQLEEHVRSVGAGLVAHLGDVIEAIGGAELGPQRIAEGLGLDKVLISRVLKTVRQESPVDGLHHAPGPAPLRRFLRAAKRKHELSDAVLGEASAAIQELELLLDERLGGRSVLTSLLTAWSDSVRAEFELRRKQAAWRAMSELYGSVADLSLSSVVLSPADTPDRLDVTWVVGLMGVQRLRPGVDVTVTTRRNVLDGASRSPLGLDGAPLGDLVGDRLDEFCTLPVGRVGVERCGETQQYTLEGDDYGPGSAIDVLFAEVNRAEMPSRVAAGSGRRRWVSKTCGLCAKTLAFDVLVHRDVDTGSLPELILLRPEAGPSPDINDPAHERFRLDLLESAREIRPAPESLALQSFPAYPSVVRHVLDRLEHPLDAFRVFRVEIDYPLVGMHAALAFAAPEA